MLYNLDWLATGKNFPPLCEMSRIERYKQNAKLFDGDHFADPTLRSRTPEAIAESPVNLYLECAKRISRVVGNFDELISFPVLLNYQRLMSLKMADLVCGEYPTITGAEAGENEAIKDVRDASDFDAKLYTTALDISRYGDAIWRVYKDYDGRMNFTPWTPIQWYPIVRQDGTNSISKHCLCWIENRSPQPIEKPDLYLVVQIHSCEPKEIGYYEQQTFHLNQQGTIGAFVSGEKVKTGLDRCAVMHLRAYSTTTSVYGYDDYMTIDSLLAEIMTRVGQISAILDKHADPNITGPVSMLTVDQKTGEAHLDTGKFFAVSPGEEQPKYMTWDGQLSAAFKQLEFLINQLYILSEMGAAILGGQDGSGQAISGTAMRFKMVNPLAKARRISNALTRPVRILFSMLSKDADTEEKVELPIPYKKISVFWADGLPDDPRENIENCKLATGETKMMPLEKGIMEFFGRSNEEARKWIDDLHAQAEANQAAAGFTNPEDDDPNKPGPQDGTGVNPQKKGSKTGLNDFHGLNNKDGKEGIG